MLVCGESIIEVFFGYFLQWGAATSTSRLPPSAVRRSSTRLRLRLRPQSALPPLPTAAPAAVPTPPHHRRLAFPQGRSLGRRPHMVAILAPTRSLFVPLSPSRFRSPRAPAVCALTTSPMARHACGCSLQCDLRLRLAHLLHAPSSAASNVTESTARSLILNMSTPPSPPPPPPPTPLPASPPLLTELCLHPLCHPHRLPHRPPSICPWVSGV